MSDRESLRAKLLALLEEEMGETYELPKDDQDLRETLGLDSVDLVGLVMRIEREFHVRLASEELGRVKQVGDLLDLMEAKLSAAAQPVSSGPRSDGGAGDTGDGLA
jgi:acyl carrier protein